MIDSVSEELNSDLRGWSVRQLVRQMGPSSIC